MKEYIIEGGKPLRGEICLQTSKNALLPMLAAGILCQKSVTFTEVPQIDDIKHMLEILSMLGAKINRMGKSVTIDYGGIENCVADCACQTIRASVCLIGALVGRFGRAEIPLPGGCQIGMRPIDIHLDGFQKMGCRTLVGDTVIVECERLTGAKIRLRLPSVGATENMMIAAVCADGETIIENAAREPEIIDLARFLSAMGAKIKGAGTKKIVVQGKAQLRGTVFSAQKDRIEGGTFLTAFASTGGEGEIIGVSAADLAPILDIFIKTACNIRVKNDRIYLKSARAPKGIRKIVTGPHPAFPTDMQSIILPYVLKWPRECQIRETLFENRFLCAKELQRIGANLSFRGDTLVVCPSTLYGGAVRATDLRCGAGLVIAALSNPSITVVKDISHLRRGYENLLEKLSVLGANIRES